MVTFAGRLGLAFALAAVCVGGRTAHAQGVPMGGPGWLATIANPAAGQTSSPYGNLAGFGGGDAQDGGLPGNNLPSGWFVGGESGGTGLSMAGVNQLGAFGNLGALHYEGTRFGYNFKNAPVSVYGGFDTLKYNTGTGGAFAAFDSAFGTPAGYSAHAGVEFRPTSNLSLSFGAGFTQQQSGRIDSDINSPLLPGASPFFFGGRR